MLTGVALFLLLLVALLAIPVTLTFRLAWQQTLRGQVQLGWAFGLLRVRIPLSKTASASSAGDKPLQKKARHREPPRKGGNPFRLMRQKPFRRRIIRFVGELWRALHKQDVRLRLRVGLGDPADTGQLWAIMGPLAGVLANTREASITIEPDFMDALFEFDGSGRIRFVPLQLLWLTLAMLLSPPVRQGMMQMRRTAS
ncbi:MAG TPA: DUF2953 domain-containing protein [Gammaproteobacteria bacterium]